MFYEDIHPDSSSENTDDRYPQNVKGLYVRKKINIHPLIKYLLFFSVVMYLL